MAWHHNSEGSGIVVFHRLAGARARRARRGGGHRRSARSGASRAPACASAGRGLPRRESRPQLADVRAQAVERHRVGGRRRQQRLRRRARSGGGSSRKSSKAARWKTRRSPAIWIAKTDLTPPSASGLSAAAQTEATSRWTISSSFSSGVCSAMWSRIRKSSRLRRRAAPPPRRRRAGGGPRRRCAAATCSTSARSRSLDHTLTITTSQSASARSDDWRSKVRSPSPDSMLSVPCRSSTSVLFALVLSHAPLVVCTGLRRVHHGERRAEQLVHQRARRSTMAHDRDDGEARRVRREAALCAMKCSASARRRPPPRAAAVVEELESRRLGHFLTCRGRTIPRARALARAHMGSHGRRAMTERTTDAPPSASRSSRSASRPRRWARRWPPRRRATGGRTVCTWPKEKAPATSSRCALEQPGAQFVSRGQVLEAGQEIVPVLEGWRTHAQKKVSAEGKTYQAYDFVRHGTPSQRDKVRHGGRGQALSSAAVEPGAERALRKFLDELLPPEQREFTSLFVLMASTSPPPSRGGTPRASL